MAEQKPLDYEICNQLYRGHKCVEHKEHTKTTSTHKCFCGEKWEEVKT